MTLRDQAKKILTLIENGPDETEEIFLLTIETELEAIARQAVLDFTSKLQSTLSTFKIPQSGGGAVYANKHSVSRHVGDRHR